MKLRNCPLNLEVQKTLHRFPVKGVTVTAIRRGSIVESYSAGMRDENVSSMTEDVLFEAASLTKSLFATLFLRLCDRGTVSLDQPVLDQMPDVRWSDDPRYARITPHMILCHGSGLPNWASKPMGMLFDPGTDFHYSGEGYYLLQQLVEYKTGESLPALFEKEFFSPWGMDASGVWTPAVGNRMSVGFGKNGAVVKRRNAIDLSGYAPEPNAAWSLYANAKLYAQFLCKMIQEHGGLSADTFDRMTSRQNDGGPGIFWGLGWGIPSKEQSVLWHWGDNEGFKSFVVWDKDTGDGLTVFTNSDSGMPFCLDLCRIMTNCDFFNEIENFIAHAE